MNILALDPACHCGFAVTCGISGTWDLNVRRDESSSFRLIRLRGKLNEIRDNCGVDMVVFEAARNAGPRMQGAVVVQAEFQSVIKVWCEDNHIPYRGYSPSEIKKFATGAGNASKSLMVEAALKKWPGRKFASSDEIDALFLLELAMRDYGK